jgi:dTDP-4-dehydrorhamnose reductase
MKKILVTGCNGQLGSDCMSVLSGAAGLDVPEIDITDSVQCSEQLDRCRPDVIVNCAAYTAVDDCETDPGCWEVNARGPGILAEWAARNGAFLVHISTDYVFDGAKPLFHAYTESDPTEPCTQYGRSKLAGEEAVFRSGADACVLRTAWLYGRNGKNILKTMLRLATERPQREIRVVDDQFGSPTWSYTLARQIAAVIEAGSTGVFHAASGGYCSWFELSDTFLSLMGVEYRMVPCTTEEFPRPAPRPRNSILENSMLNQYGLNMFDDWRSELEAFVTGNRNVLLEEARGAGGDVSW